MALLLGFGLTADLFLLPAFGLGSALRLLLALFLHFDLLLLSGFLERGNASSFFGRVGIRLGLAAGLLSLAPGFLLGDALVLLALLLGRLRRPAAHLGLGSIALAGLGKLGLPLRFCELLAAALLLDLDLALAGVGRLLVLLPLLRVERGLTLESLLGLALGLGISRR